MSRSEDSNWSLDWQRALLPISLLILFILRFGFRAPLWVLIVFSCWIPLYYLGYPWLLRRRWRDFERTFTAQFQRENFDELLDEYESRWFLRQFGPRGKMLAKLGLIYAGLERFREAERALERAVERVTDVDRDKVLFNLANVKYELGKYDDAEEIYRSLQGSSPYRRSIRTQLALIELHRGENVDEAEQLLREEREHATGRVRERIDRALD
ncbi:MAG: tetratricopeptide repeat protein [Bradymonadaceae bacterium]